MNVLGIELCDAGLLAACEDGDAARLAGPAATTGDLGWPAVSLRRGDTLVHGSEAEAAWFEHPRLVSHLFWEKLSHEPSDLQGPNGSPYSFSQLAFYFLNDYVKRLRTDAGAADKIVLAIPGHYLRDPATEEEKIGLLLGMAAEMKLPLVRIVDMGCAALWEPAAREFPRSLPIIHVDVHLHGAEISLMRREEDNLVRAAYHHVPQAGYAQVLRHLKNAMGNRFLRHTAFDIHEDRRLEQAFYEQTKQFLLSPSQGEREFLYQLNTGYRSYQMMATRTQLESDIQGFDQMIVLGVSTVAADAGIAPARCVVSLTDRAARLDGLRARLRDAGFGRIFALRQGAAALGAATLARDWPALEDLADCEVDTRVPLHHVAAHDRPVESVLHRAAEGADRPAPSHVIVDGIGHAIGAHGLTLGTRHALSGVDVALPEAFDGVGDYVVRVLREGNELKLEIPGGSAGDAPAPLSAGDRLALRSGGLAAELIFAFCPDVSANGHR
jgi:hypothetical protein